MDNRLTAYEMNSGDKAWSMAVVPTPDSINNHSLLEGVVVPETGGDGWSIQMVVDDLLVQNRAMSDGMAQSLPDAPLTLNARDKFIGKIVGSESLPATGQYGMMTYMHQGRADRQHAYKFFWGLSCVQAGIRVKVSSNERLF